MKTTKDEIALNITTKEILLPSSIKFDCYLNHGI